MTALEAGSGRDRLVLTSTGLPPCQGLPDRLPERQRERNEIRQANGMLLPPFQRWLNSSDLRN